MGNYSVKAKKAFKIVTKLLVYQSSDRHFGDYASKLHNSILLTPLNYRTRRDTEKTIMVDISRTRTKHFAST